MLHAPFKRLMLVRCKTLRRGCMLRSGGSFLKLEASHDFGHERVFEPRARTSAAD